MPKAFAVAVRVLGLLLLVAGAPALSGGAPTAEAGSIIVTTTADSGPGSFRDALSQAGANPGLDVITFDPSVFPEANPATIMATDVYKIEGNAASQPLTIDGSGAGVIISGAQVPNDNALLEFSPIGPLSGITLRGFTLQMSIAASFDGGEGIELGEQVTDVTDVLLERLTVRENEGIGIALKAAGTMSNVVVRDSEIAGNGFHGLFLEAHTLDNVQVTGNHISENEAVGIEVKGASSPLPATNAVSGNEVLQNDSDGILVAALSDNGGFPHVTVTQNTTTANGGLGIDLAGGNEDGSGVTANDAGDGDDGPNDLLNFPVINGAGPTGITGTACANCIIELFIADSDPSGHGEGAGYFTTGMADQDGNFNISGCGQNEGANVTATATDADGNTSEFALNYILPFEPPCAPDNGDLDCDGDEDARDALIAFIHESGADQISREPNCPDLGSSLASVSGESAGPDLFGDVNCDGDVGAGDGLTLLQHASDLELDPPPAAGCTPIGEPLS